jgi:hypothetical protein
MGTIEQFRGVQRGAESDLAADLIVDPDADIDIAIDDRDEGERRAVDLADRIQRIAQQDPELAQGLVDQLIVALDRALGGTFREHLDGPARLAADRALAGGGSDVSSR